MQKKKIKNLIIKNIKNYFMDTFNGRKFYILRGIQQKAACFYGTFSYLFETYKKKWRKHNIAKKKIDLLIQDLQKKKKYNIAKQNEKFHLFFQDFFF